MRASLDDAEDITDARGGSTLPIKLAKIICFAVARAASSAQRLYEFPLRFGSPGRPKAQDH